MVDDQQPCGWNALLPPRTPTVPAEGRIQAKYVIIGAGYTGVACARRLGELDPENPIVLLESTIVGEGASGRNSGFVGGLVLPKANFASKDQNPTNTQAITSHRPEFFNDAGFQWLKSLIERYHIDCDLHIAGSFRAAVSRRSERLLMQTYQAVSAKGVKLPVLDREQLYRQTGTRYYRRGILVEDTRLIQPAALIRGLSDTLPASVALHERSAAKRFRRAGDQWLIETDRASISADTLVLANSASIREFGLLRDRLVGLFTYAGITEAMSAADSGHLGERPSWGITSVQRAGSSTLRRVGHDRFMVRSVHSYERSLPIQKVREELSKRFHRRYPALSHIQFEHVWGGLTDLTGNGAPIWGELAPKLWLAAGYNGLGIAKGTILGKSLAEKILGADSHTELMLAYGKANWLPPEPFRRIGFGVATAIARLRAGADGR